MNHIIALFILMTFVGCATYDPLPQLITAPVPLSNIPQIAIRGEGCAGLQYESSNDGKNFVTHTLLRPFEEGVEYVGLHPAKPALRVTIFVLKPDSYGNFRLDQVNGTLETLDRWSRSQPFQARGDCARLIELIKEEEASSKWPPPSITDA